MHNDVSLHSNFFNDQAIKPQMILNELSPYESSIQRLEHHFISILPSHRHLSPITNQQSTRGVPLRPNLPPASPRNKTLNPSIPPIKHVSQPRNVTEDKLPCYQSTRTNATTHEHLTWLLSIPTSFWSGNYSLALFDRRTPACKTGRRR